MKNLKAFALLAIGYLLMFAAVYSKGKYALRPWKALEV